MTTTYPKRLIEVDLPIKRISAHARREKSIRHGHISTLHIWWARRPLAACRAVICAALWPDPADPLCPQAFRDAAASVLNDFGLQVNLAKVPSNLLGEDLNRWRMLESKPLDPNDSNHQLAMRGLLLDFIASFSAWECSTEPTFLATSRALTQAAHEALGGEPGTRPLVVDPFAGGGSIPLEALRVGADAFASDLNPVAVLLNKVVLEYIPKYGNAEITMQNAEGKEVTFHGLAEAVRYWGEWVKKEAEKELAEFYPKDPDGATPIAYLWARTIKCEGPGCGAEVPLMRSLWLAKKGRNSVALRIIPNPKENRVDFEIIENAKASDVGNGTVARGSATCPCCGYTVSAQNVRDQFHDRHGGAWDARLLAIVLTKEGQMGRWYRIPTEEDINSWGKTIKKAEELAHGEGGSAGWIPNETLPYLRSIFNIQLLGVNAWSELFTPRQLVTLSTFARLIRSLGDVDSPENGRVIQILLTLALGKMADLCNSLCPWEPIAQCPRHLFGRQAIGIVWDFAEGNPIGDSSGSWAVHIDSISRAIASIQADWNSGQVQQLDAANHSLPDDIASLLITDPPYYDAIPYADLSDFFYVWQKRALGFNISPLSEDGLTPKREEIVQLAERNSKYAYKTRENFERRMCQSLTHGRRITVSDGLGVFVFAHKGTDAWESMLNAVMDAGWIFIASWPIDTEMGSRLRAMGSAVLASSIHLVCRPREDESGNLRTDDIGDWRDVLDELPNRIHEWMPRLAAEGVVGADAIFACLGPALEVYSRYSRVEKASGEQVTLKEYLEHVWAAVAKEALNMIFDQGDASGLEEDARLTAMWFWTLKTSDDAGEGDSSGDDADEGDDEKGGASSKKSKMSGFVLEYDAARKIAQGLGAHLEQLTSLVEVKGDKARLIPVGERAAYLFGKPKSDTPKIKGRKRKEEDQEMLFTLVRETEHGTSGDLDPTSPPQGKTVLDRVHQTMLMFSAGRSDAMKRFLVEDGVGRDPRFWSLAQSLSALYPPSTDEKRWVDGVLARKKGLGF